MTKTELLESNEISKLKLGPDPISEALEKAQDILMRYLVPDGIDAETAINELLGVLDNRRLVIYQRGAQRQLAHYNNLLSAIKMHYKIGDMEALAKVIGIIPEVVPLEAEAQKVGAANCSLIPKRDREMIFRVCQKLNAVLGLNEQEKKWLASLGAEFPKANDQTKAHE
jgi:hypothetical protein